MGGAGDGAPDIPNAAGTSFGQFCLSTSHIDRQDQLNCKNMRPIARLKHSIADARSTPLAIATVVLAGSTVTGKVRSIVEDNSSSLKRWIVAIDPTSLPPTFPFRKKLRTSNW